MADGPDPAPAAAGRLDQFTIDRDALALLFGHVEELVVVCDETGTIVFISPSVRAFLGYDPASVVGLNLFDFIHPEERDDVVDSLLRWTDRKGTPRGQVQRVLASDGSYVKLYYDSAMGPALGELGWIAVTARPPDDHDAQRRELFQRLHNEDRLVRLASAFLHVGVEEFDEGLSEALLELSGLEWVTRVSIWESDGDRVALRGQWVANLNAPSRPLPSRLPVASSTVLRRLAAGEEVHIRSVPHLPEEWEAERSFLRNAGVRSMLAMPMVAKGRFNGFVMAEVTLAEIAFDATHVSALRQAAAILAEALARHEIEVELLERAGRDALTGLPNRWAFNEALERALDDGSGSAHSVAVALVDLDRFKRVNDTLGHVAGDRLLEEVAGRLRSAAAEQSGMSIARLGGDSLLVLLDEVPGPAEAAARTEQLLRALEPPFDVAGNPVVITASAGVAHSGEGGVDGVELLRRADVVMYRAKERGGNRVEVDGEETRAAVADRLRREAELRAAIEGDGLVAWYQGEWDLATGTLVGAEALARWIHPSEGVIEAGGFVPMAEDTGLVDALGRRVLRQACTDLAAWRASGAVDDTFVMRFNVSARQLQGDGLLAAIEDVLADTGLPGSVLCIELTESALLVDPERAVAVLTELRSRGLGLAVDDFGTGYSSMLYLKRLPVTCLKIDRAFVSGLPDDTGDRAIVSAIVQLADELGVTVTAEGVETESQRDGLVSLGCRRAQGFLLARPEPSDAFADRF